MEKVYYKGIEFEVKNDILRLSNIGINSLKEITGMDKLTNLKKLYLDRNSISELTNLKNLQNLEVLDLKTVIPKYNQLEYIGSLESVTLAKDNSIYIVDDPWHSFFIPPAEILNQLDERTIKNFKEYIPVIYKYLPE